MNVMSMMFPGVFGAVLALVTLLLAPRPALGAFGGSCEHGKLADQALRRQDDHCGSCDLGYSLATTTAHQFTLVPGKDDYAFVVGTYVQNPGKPINGHPVYTKSNRFLAWNTQHWCVADIGYLNTVRQKQGWFGCLADSADGNGPPTTLSWAPRYAVATTGAVVQRADFVGGACPAGSVGYKQTCCVHDGCCFSDCTAGGHYDVHRDKLVLAGAEWVLSGGSSPRYQLEYTTVCKRAFGGSCDHGELADQALRRQDDHCGSCHPGYQLTADATSTAVTRATLGGSCGAGTHIYNGHCCIKTACCLEGGGCQTSRWPDVPDTFAQPKGTVWFGRDKHSNGNAVHQLLYTTVCKRAFVGSCDHGELADQALRHQDDHCGSCDPGYQLAAAGRVVKKADFAGGACPTGTHDYQGRACCLTGGCCFSGCSTNNIYKSAMDKFALTLPGAAWVLTTGSSHHHRLEYTTACTRSIGVAAVANRSAAAADTDATEQGCACQSDYGVKGDACANKRHSGCMKTPCDGDDGGAARGYPSWCFVELPCAGALGTESKWDYCDPAAKPGKVSAQARPPVLSTAAVTTKPTTTTTTTPPSSTSMSTSTSTDTTTSTPTTTSASTATSSSTSTSTSTNTDTTTSTSTSASTATSSSTITTSSFPTATGTSTDTMTPTPTLSGTPTANTGTRDLATEPNGTATGGRVGAAEQRSTGGTTPAPPSPPSQTDGAHEGPGATLGELAALENEAKAKVKAYYDLLALHKCQELGDAGDDMGAQTAAEEHCASLRANADLASVAYGEAARKRLDAAAAAGALATPPANTTSAASAGDVGTGAPPNSVASTSVPQDAAGAGDAGDAGAGAMPIVIAAAAVVAVLLLAAGAYAAKQKVGRRADHEFDDDDGGGNDGNLPPLPPLPPAGTRAGPVNGHGVVETRFSDDGIADQILDQVLRTPSESASLGDTNGQEPTYETIQATNRNTANAYGLLTGAQAQYGDAGQAYEVMDLRAPGRHSPGVGGGSSTNGPGRADSGDYTLVLDTVEGDAADAAEASAKRGFSKGQKGKNGGKGDLRSARHRISLKPQHTDGMMMVNPMRATGTRAATAEANDMPPRRASDV